MGEGGGALFVAFPFRYFSGVPPRPYPGSLKHAKGRRRGRNWETGLNFFLDTQKPKARAACVRFLDISGDRKTMYAVFAYVFRAFCVFPKTFEFCVFYKNYAFFLFAYLPAKVFPKRKANCEAICG